MLKLPRFYPILDRQIAAQNGYAAVDAASRILGAGARILQFRHKGAFTREVFEEMERIARLCATHGVRFIVNDRADLARLLDAGLHLGQEDLTPEQARRVVGADCCIGYSTHNADQLRAAAAQPADYLAIGPVFATASKANPDPVVGIATIRKFRGLTNRPLVAIGGITRGNARSVIDAGADSVAVIGDLFPDITKRVGEFLAV